VELAGLERVRSPALIVDLDAVDHNLSVTLGLLDGHHTRWRPHLKTVKLALVMRRIRALGVEQAKTSTTLELETACEAGFSDVLLAYPAVGPAVDLVKRIALEYPGVRISALVEDPVQVEPWIGSGVGGGLFIDLDSGMNRTGMQLGDAGRVLALARKIEAAGLRFRGLHFYDGHAADFAPGQAESLVHRGYDRLARLVAALRADGVSVPEVVTAGTPAFPHARRYAGFPSGTLHRVSPGTVVYNDRRSLAQLAGLGYRPAVLVMSRVVSHRGPDRFCADAGHKSISADAGDPICEVVGRPEYQPRHPSEEHLPIEVASGTVLPERGERLWLLPTHVCPTVNNFDYAVIVAGGTILGVERVTARGRHAPL